MCRRQWPTPAGRRLCTQCHRVGRFWVSLPSHVWTQGTVEGSREPVALATHGVGVRATRVHASYIRALSPFWRSRTFQDSCCLMDRIQSSVDVARAMTGRGQLLTEQMTWRTSVSGRSEHTVLQTPT